MWLAESILKHIWVDRGDRLIPQEVDEFIVFPGDRFLSLGLNGAI